MANRNLQRAEDALNSLIKSYPLLDLEKKAHIMPLDLTSFDSVKEFAKLFREKFDRCDVLINNAGVMMCPYELTKDGHEMQFGTNHLGHFLLTNLLFDLLLKSTDPRVINVSSSAHQFK
mmetsp:Transcript_17258/g.38024  ORF Transcript_17258/g.38024 Transcript_17258/m.38024 type:complete len:119 (+) Transcript_17258:182-538(+)|eukprot:CAMPEP_0116898610 /NCGR_PEP_ID=MMETSP0467-20121206/7311_1 /TAXON_ID=283647 /ORGANISM="Mesodinium pulex, Strain SPMC105" /LENGTH=118 /DNA_ID=CAMNT_0004570867 /DNA_START=182 /DNA_END=538 /DNA_ORIENTATION=+